MAQHVTLREENELGICCRRQFVLPDPIGRGEALECAYWCVDEVVAESSDMDAHLGFVT